MQGMMGRMGGGQGTHSQFELLLERSVPRDYQETENHATVGFSRAQQRAHLRNRNKKGLERWDEAHICGRRRRSPTRTRARCCFCDQGKTTPVLQTKWLRPHLCCQKCSACRFDRFYGDSADTRRRRNTGYHRRCIAVVYQDCTRARHAIQGARHARRSHTHLSKVPQIVARARTEEAKNRTFRSVSKQKKKATARTEAAKNR
eukprot:32749_1